MGKVKAILAKKLKRSLQIKSVGRIKKWKNMSVLGVCKSGALIEKKTFYLILYISFCCFNSNKE